MMDSTARALLELLASFATQRIPHLEDAVDWTALAALAERHSVDAIVAAMLPKLPESQRPPQALRDELQRQMHLTAAVSMRRELAMRALMQEMERERIDHLLMKGFVVRDYYPTRELRTFSDIDILIRAQDEPRMDALMERLGYHPCILEQCVHSYHKGIESYEIHTNILPDMRREALKYSHYVSHAWAHAALTHGACGYTFTPEYHTFYLLLHLAKHLSARGAGIRMFLDIAVCIRSGPTTDWARVFEIARGVQLEAFCGHVLALCARWFGVALPHPLPAGMSEACYMETCDYVFDGGTFGSFDRRHMVPLRVAMESTPANVAAAQKSLICSLLFPPTTWMSQKYPWLRGNAWLLPIGWALRGIIGLCNRNKRPALLCLGGYMRHGQEAKRQHGMLRELGLTTQPG